MVILFTDLKDGTHMYDEHGDASAFSMVHDHFNVLKKILRKNSGAIVKTIVDAVMAGFQQPLDAIKSSFEFLEEFRLLNRDIPENERIILKIGIHQGPCIALNLNDLLDYFGGTVNKAARIQGLCEGDNRVISSAINENPDVKYYLAKKRSNTEHFKSKNQKLI
jgi:class 3 adenylate cyclase